ncbi:rap1 GTPase-activating protein 1-like [Gracilinanus agilis]|uniref:rap1 GTPase-activating protein 1-like n=1 Tax=Gracilinanus agilis TaxID=191870 RepID=UPI001CFEB349|nr:rap1 GTPase-activating protein 1-like [Gracilinanus agilis]
MIEKMQGSRMDEQRCSFPPPLKTEEDYIPYPSVHEVTKDSCSPLPLPQPLPSLGEQTTLIKNPLGGSWVAQWMEIQA